MKSLFPTREDPFFIYTGGIIILLSLIASIARFYYQVKGKRGSLFFRLLYHHSLIDIFLSFWNLYIYLWWYFQLEDAQFEMVAVVLLLFCLNISSTFTAHFTICGYLKLMNNTVYEERYRSIVSWSYGVPFILMFTSLISNIITDILKVPHGQVYSTLLLFFLPLVGTLIVMGYNYKIWKTARSYNVKIDYRNLVYIPIFQGLIYLLLLVFFSIELFGYATKISLGLFISIQYLLIGYPLWNFMFYFAPIYNQYRSSVLDKTEIRETLACNDVLDDSFREEDVLRVAGNLGSLV